MSRLTVEGQQALGELCRRHGVGDETGLVLLDALSRTNGTMAQFNLPELGGSGQWMSGGMVMVGDMFNQGLKARVDALCYDLAALLSAEPFPPVPTPAGASLFVDARGGTTGQWWPGSLGTPNWQGSQNDLRYAYFAVSDRLALDIRGDVAVYDTGGFTLTGVSQQQSSGYGAGYGANLTFTGPGGIVTLDRLRRIDGGGATAPAGAAEPTDVSGRAGDRSEAPPVADPGDRPDERLSGTRWFYAPKEGAALVLVSLDAEGSLGGAHGDTTRYWALDDGALWFYAADGRPTARFDRIVRGSDGLRIVGTSPPNSGLPVVLRAQAPCQTATTIPAVPGTTTLELRLDLADREWVFGEQSGRPLATLRLLGDGTLAGSSRPTEVAWRVEGSQLVFLHKSGRPTTRFTTITVHNGLWTLSGPSLANDRIVHELRPKTY